MARHHKSKRTKKGILRKGISTLQKGSRKALTSVKSGIEGVGKTVSQKAIPTAQKSIRNLFGLIGFSKTKTRKHKSRRSRK